MFFNGTKFALGGSSYLYRIPSTFPGEAQYLFYLLSVTACTTALTFLERSSVRTTIARALLLMNCVATLVCGERGAFIYLHSC